MNKIKNKVILSLIFVSCLGLAGIFSDGGAFADDGWIGTGSSEQKPGVGGGGGCDPKKFTFQIDCAGTSWAFYKRKNTTSKDLVFPNGNSDYLNPVKKPKIKAECSERGGGGFYHFGINASGYKYKNSEWDVWGGTETLGHWFTLAWRSISHPGIPGEGGIPKKGKKHKITENGKDSGKVIYKFDSFSKNPLGRYKQACRYKYGKNSDKCNVSKIPSGVWGFCWWPDMDKEATVKIYPIDEYTKNYISDTGILKSSAASSAVLSATVAADGTKDVSKTVWTPNHFDSNNNNYSEIVGISTQKGKITTPSTSGKNRVTFNSSTRNLTVSDITKDQTVYVFYRRKVTLKVIDVDYTTPASPRYFKCDGTHGTKATACIHEVEVTVGKKGSVNLNKPAHSSYTNLVGITSELGKKGGLSLVSGSTFTTSSVMTGNKVYYANYITTPTVKLTVKKITETGRELGNCGTSTVKKSATASVTCSEYHGSLVFSYFTSDKNGSRASLPGTISGRTYKEAISKDTTRYAVYIGTPPPPPPPQNCKNGSNLLSEFVKNTSVSAYNTWLSRVYAKPGDDLVYCTDYNPSTPQGSSGYNYTNYEVADNSCSAIFPIGRAYNQANSFITKQSKGINSNAIWGGSTVISKAYIPGLTSRQQESNNYSNVLTSDVGKTIDERAETIGNTPTAGNARSEKSPDGTTSRGKCVKWVCVKCYSYSCNCRSCNCSTSCSENGSCTTSCSTCCDTCYKDTYYHYSRGFPATTTTYYSSVAQAHIPYNYENTTEITKPTDETEKIDPETEHHIVYAGETEMIYFDFNVNARQNNTTDGNYATKVDNSKRQLEIAYNGQTYYTNTDTETLYNTSVDGMSSYTKSYSREIIIPDLPAGTEITVRSMVYPANSGPETNWTDQGGNHQWAYSEPITYIIAKRPSLDVWGGNVFNNSQISTSTATKYQLDGVTAYTPDRRNRNTAYLFGSWGELGMISNDNILGMASGASLGKTYGSIETSPNYSRRVPLTFANYPTVTPLGQSAANNRFNRDREHLLAKYFFEDTEIPDIDEDEPPLNDDGYDVGNNVFYYHSVNDLSLSETSINAGTTQVVFSEENVHINGNLTYGDNIEGRKNYLFGNFINIPKLIIYAKNEIQIDCSVNRVDAVLIAEKVTTCINSQNEPDEDIITDGTNSNRLVIFGAVIANTLVANRTYGAEPGVNGISSTSPAEIIIFDPTLYRLENNTDDASQTEAANADTKLVTTYLKELSPRY